MLFSLNDFNFLVVLLFSLVFIFLTLSKTTLWLLVISELFWITLYALALVLSLVDDNIQILSLSLFFLMFSAVEISTGLGIIVYQSNVFSSLNIFNTNDMKTNKIPR